MHEEALNKFNDCVREKLDEDDFELNDLIDTYFPQYEISTADTSGDAVNGTDNVGLPRKSVTVELSNVDDVATVYLNGTPIFESRWGIIGPILPGVESDSANQETDTQGSSGGC